MFFKGLIPPFHSQGQFGAAVHHISKSLFQLGRCNCINAARRMEVRKRGPYITSESHSTYKTGSPHYLPVNQTGCINKHAPPCHIPLLHLFPV